MTITPDPKTVRECAKYPDTAWGRIRAYLDNATTVLSRVDLGELLAENVQLKRKLEWPDEQPQDPQPWPRVQRMPLAIAGQHVQPWHHQAIAEYDKATGNTTLPHSNLPGMYAAAQVNQAIIWWNERAGAEQPQDDGDVRAVARALRELRLNNPGVMALKGVTRLEERFASRIAKLPKRTPIQGSGYTPLQLLGVVDDRDATAAARKRVAELAERAEEEQ